MPKFTNAERNLVKSIVATLSLKRIPEKEIIDEIFNQTNKTLTQSGLFRIKKTIKHDSYQWYKKMREGQHEYIHEFKERISEIMNLQKMHHAIIDSNKEPTVVKQTSMAELHRLNITLSNYFDVAPSILNGITISTSSQSKVPTRTTEPERNNFIV